MPIQDQADAALQAYWEARADLIEQEASLRYDAVKRSNLSDLERRADAVLGKLKQHERKTVWECEDDVSCQAGMAFRGAIHRDLRATQMWRVIRRMPKGALLHCHMDGTVPATWLIEEAVKYDTTIHIRSEMPLDSVERLFADVVEFKAVPAEQSGSGDVDVYSPEYDGHSWMSLREARRRFPYANVYNSLPIGYAAGEDVPAPNGSASEDAFDAWVHSLMTMTPAPGSKPMTTSPEAWARFNSTFAIVGGFISYEPILRAYIKQMVLVHAADNIQYLEARLNFMDEEYIAADAVSKLTHVEWVRIFRESVDEAKRELASQGIFTFLDAKIIYVTVRIVTPERLRWYLDDCISLKKQFPETIVGFDLVGYEDPGVTLETYVPELLDFQRRVQEADLEIPFLFHAGETTGDGSPADRNLYDAILLKTKRIGHGFSISRHPLLLDLCKRNGICIEVCPISNEVLKYTGSVAEHPLPNLLNRGVEVALSNDDAAQFGNYGLSHDFYQVFTASSTATLASLYTLVKTSLDHARLVLPGEREKHLRLFEEQWQGWCQWLIEEYNQQQ